MRLIEDLAVWSCLRAGCHRVPALQLLLQLLLPAGRVRRVVLERGLPELWERQEHGRVGRQHLLRQLLRRFLQRL